MPPLRDMGRAAVCVRAFSIALLGLGACSGPSRPPELGDTPGSSGGTLDSGIAATEDAASLDATQDTAATPDTSVPTADAQAEAAPSDVTLPEAAPPDTCATGTLTGDTFLPGAVYFLGQIQSSPSKPIGVAHWSDPGTFCLGMPANFANWAQIRPTDGRLL